MHQSYGYAHKPRTFKGKSNIGKKILFWFVLFVLIALLSVRLFYGVLPFPFLSPSKNFQEQVNARIPIEQKELLRQTPFDCGAFNISAAINTLSQRKTTPQDLIKTIGLRKFKNKGVLPETLAKVIRSHEGLTAKIRTTKWFTDEEKIKYLKSQLAKGHPQILLVEKNDLPHYITLYGYEGDTFFIYDSWLLEQDAFFTIDNNEDEIGNMSLSADSILEMWKKAHIKDMYRWVVISVQKE